METDMQDPMNIGEAAQAAGVTAKMVRHYEDLGLIPQVSRTDAGYRQYTAREVAVLRFIRQSRAMGFSIKQISQLLGLWADANRQSRDVKALAREHIADLDRRIAEMARMKAALEPLAAGCRGDDRADCPILSGLSGGATASITVPSATAKVRSRAERPGRVARPPRLEHVGLLAWMQRVNRNASADYA